MYETLKLSVIIPTYNPDKNNLNRVLEGLKRQTLALPLWELIIIDNNSTNNGLKEIDLSWQPNNCLIKEIKQGLTYSRIYGFNKALGDIIVMVDDDNILSENYLQLTVSYFEENSLLGAIGGRIEGLFPGYVPEEWTKQFWGMLAVRNLGDQSISASSLQNGYPSCSPVGAGMAVRKVLLGKYIESINAGNGVITDRSGNNLASGGDNEICIYVLKQHYSVAYLPDLSLQHIILPKRLTKNYLAHLNYQSSKSWVRLLVKHQISPWKIIAPGTLWLRKLKAYINQKAWTSNANYIIWRGKCGAFEGLSNNKSN
jgi:glycosyltransferase involved in cell wall biosynthesis